MPNQSIVYRGAKYSVGGSCKYLSCRTSRGGTRLLHRHIWMDHFGPIPEGHVIHHKDHDKFNNDISNLEAVPTKAHAKAHLIERISMGEMPPPSKIALDKAALWHASPSGAEWHKQRALKQWSNPKTIAKLCESCGKEYTAFQSDSRYCSNPCNQRANYKKMFTEKTRCLHCGIEFFSHKYRKTTYCSRTCAIRSRKTA